MKQYIVLKNRYIVRVTRPVQLWTVRLSTLDGQLRRLLDQYEILT